MKKIILLGGVPGVGKTTIAYKLALKMQIDKVISIDIIKQILTHFITRKKEPYLYTTTHESYLLENTSIIDGYLKHSNIVNSYVCKLIENFKDNILIIEGATVNCDMIDLFDNKKYEIIYINIYANEDELIKRYDEKSKIRKGRWKENIKIIKIINNYLKENSEINIENNNFNLTVERIEKYVKKFLYVQQQYVYKS